MEPVPVRINGEPVNLHFDNTLIVLFKGADDQLDHVQYTDAQGREFYIYDQKLIERLGAVDFPIYLRADRPEWAIERFMQGQVNDLDKLLYQGGAS